MVRLTIWRDFGSIIFDTMICSRFLKVKTEQDARSIAYMVRDPAREIQAESELVQGDIWHVKYIAPANIRLLTPAKPKD